VKEAAGRCECRRGDERHQPAAPTIADVIWHRYRGVTDAGREVLRQKRADRAIDHPHVVHQDGNDKDRDWIVDIVRLRHRPEPGVEWIIGDGSEQKAAQDHRFAADVIGHPAPQDQGWRRDEQRGHHDVAGGEQVYLGDLLQEVERPELAAVPNHAFAEYHDAGNQHELDVGAEARLLPGILRHQALGLDFLEDRRFTQLEPDVDRYRDQQERHEEWHAPGPGVEHLFAIVA